MQSAMSLPAMVCILHGRPGCVPTSHTGVKCRIGSFKLARFLRMRMGEGEHIESVVF